MPEIVYDPVGRCMYCGADRYAADSNRNLATEHIIPFGLNGNLLLPQSTCRKCERTTGRFEAIVLKGSLLGCRINLGLKTRSPKERPKSFPVFDSTKKPEVKVMIDVADYPPTLLLARLGPPEALTGIAGSGNIIQLWHHQFAMPDWRLMKLKYNLTNFAYSSLDNRSFFRMLAKIAHSYAVATLRIDGFKPLLREFILEENDQVTTPFVGGIPEDQPAQTSLHVIDMEPHDTLVVVRLRLFAMLGAPTYRVVAGRWF